jgi:hypothetical protein
MFEDREFATFRPEVFVLIVLDVCRIQVGSDTEVVRQLEPFGLGEVHIQSFFGKVMQRVQSHGEWLIERREVERDRRESQNVLPSLAVRPSVGF